MTLNFEKGLANTENMNHFGNLTRNEKYQSLISTHKIHIGPMDFCHDSD